MGGLIAALVTQAASCASILGLYFALEPPTSERIWWHLVLVALPIVAAVYVMYREMVHLYTGPRTYRSAKKINSYMRRWVGSGGRVVIFSRDLTWANEPATRNLLRDKAKQNELTVCLEHTVPLATELRNEGAKIVTYGKLAHIPRSRFTIVDFGREGARVAVGVRDGSGHVIQEFRSGSHPFFAVAEDLVRFLIAISDLTSDVS
jgi:hypothetical protein